MTGTTNRFGDQGWPFFLLLALVLGAVLRLSFPGDIEYKGDERYMFEASQEVGVTQPWPALGMNSGVKIKNPGMSVWIFAALARITHASTPPELARAVQGLNILALLVLAYFSLWILPEKEGWAWRWAAAFAAVNPFAVLFHRKIWAQCTLPLFCVFFWIAWHFRQKRIGAFWVGLLGICLGQIHLSGFFLAAGVFLWTAFHDPRTRWGYWLAGSLIGLVPMVPWLQYLAAGSGGGFNWESPLWILYPKFWIYWLTDPFGIGLTYSLKTVHFLDFLRFPLIDGRGTYMVALLHLVIVASGCFLLVSAQKAGGLLWDFRAASGTGLAVNSVLWGTGLLMTLSCVKIFRHYLIMTFPLEWVWLSRLALADPDRGKSLLTALWAAQLLLSILFLVYIHINHGDPLGDYGVGYQYQ